MTVAQTITTTEPALAAIEAAAATTLPYSPVSNVKGLAFDRFIQVWLENVVSGSSIGYAGPQVTEFHARITALPLVTPTSSG